MKRKRAYLFLLAAVQMLEILYCAGCGKNAAAGVPELLEPASVNSAYRPVEKGDIGTLEILFGTVVPVDYCNFYHTNVTVSEICVEVGDYVEEGEVLAYADIDAAREKIAELQAELDYENQTYELNCRIADEKILELSYTDQSGTAIATEQENKRYDELLHQYRTGKLSASMSEQQEIIADGTLRAGHSGYVTFIKNIAADSNAGASENIVIVSDTDDTYIELEDVTADSYKFGDYEVKYLKIAGETYEVTEIPYTSEEMILCKASGKYPRVRLSCEGTEALTIGDTYPVYYMKKRVQDVLMVGNDSLYEDDDSYYVYVKTETGEKEKRRITIGEQDDNYTEVLSGLAEGEPVYYESEARMPADYETYTAALSDFEIENCSDSYQLSNELAFLYSSKYEGTITEVAVEKSQEVKEGDLLYVIDIGEGKAALTEAQNQIDRENLSYTDIINGYDMQIAALSESQTPETATEGDEKPEDADAVEEGTDFGLTEAEASMSRECLECELRILSDQKELSEIEHEYRLQQLQKAYDEIGKGNDGNGKVSVYAEESGIVSKLLISSGDKVAVGDELLSVSTAASDKLLVQMAPIDGVTSYSDNIADLGETVTIKTGDAVYTGTCIGWTVNAVNNGDEVYPYTDSEGACLSYSAESGYTYPAFYVSMEDAAFYENMPKGRMTFSYIRMKDAVVIPSSMIYSETVQTGSNKTYDYVWRVQDQELVKQYVKVDDSLVSGDGKVVLSGIKAGDVLAAEK